MPTTMLQSRPVTRTGKREPFAEEDIALGTIEAVGAAGDNAVWTTGAGEATCVAESGGVRVEGGLTVERAGGGGRTTGLEGVAPKSAATNDAPQLGQVKDCPSFFDGTDSDFWHFGQESVTGMVRA